MFGSVVVRVPNHPAREVRIERLPFSIGRDRRNDLVLDDDRVSRQHALVDGSDGQLLVADIGSRNGTTLNGTVLRVPTALADGDMLQMGDSSLWFNR